MLCDKKRCTGCFSCYNACPNNAIEMKEDKCGYIYPEINSEKCINCKLCENVCPTLNKIQLNKPLKCYATRVKDEEKLKKSTSGGIATCISEKILEDNGVIYGASFVDNCVVNHIRVEKKEELDKLRGSKYVHSYIKDTYKQAKKDLLNNKKVLFIGTPCQIAGLKRFLNKEYDKLYVIDIICHGVPSQRFLKDEVNRIVKDTNIERVNFRDKKFKIYTFSIKKDGNDVFEERWTKSPYFHTFMNSITYRDNCYLCEYATSNRCSDLTIGDFWGLKKDSKFYSTEDKGVSVLLPITNKGIKLIETIKNDIEIEERNIKEAIDGNEQLREAAKKSKKVDKFKKIYKGNFYKTYKKVMRTYYYKQIIKSNKLVKKILELKKGTYNVKG